MFFKKKKKECRFQTICWHNGKPVATHFIQEEKIIKGNRNIPSVIEGTEISKCPICHKQFFVKYTATIETKSTEE